MKKTALNHLYTSLMLLLVAVVLNQCGTSKNTPITRTYHNLTSYYNILFNGRESFEKGLRQYRNDYQYDFTRILPVHIHGNSKLAKSIRPQMERTIEKCSKLIRLHSITAKPEKLEKKGKLTQEEKAYYNKNEFNKYVDDSYLLMGRAYYWEMEYQTASKVLEYAAREFKNEQVRDRANIWRSRCYIEIGNYNEAQKVLSGLKDREPDPQVKPAFYATYADLHIRQDQYSQALPYLKKSVKHQPDNTIRERHAFIIAQLYEEMDQPEKAFDQYQKVIAMNPDYRLEFNAMLKKAWLHHLTNRGGEKMKEQLKKMLHDSKNEEYRDQIYYALGQIAQQNDQTDKALEYYKKSARQSVSNKNQKGISFLALADIYFSHKKYETAQAYYDSAVTSLEPSYPGYTDLYVKTRHLTGLVDNLNTIERQDSLQKVAQMPKAERDALISKLIEQHRQRQREKRQQQASANRYAGRSGSRQMGRAGRSANNWYFYSQTARQQGKNDFKRRWGDRPLQDNWRLGSKSTGGFEDMSNPSAAPKEKKQQLNKTNRKYYTQDLPTTDSAMKASDRKIQDAYFRVASIYMNDLENRTRAIEYFKELNQKFPDNPYKPGTYYYLYKLNRELGHQGQADPFKQQIISNYPESNYAKVLKNPDYFRELEQTRNRIEQMYSRTLKLYNKGQYNRVIDSCNKALSQFDQKNYRARFEYLKVLSTGQTSDIVTFRNQLQALVKDYPNAPITPQAKGTLSYLRKTELQQIGKKFRENKLRASSDSLQNQSVSNQNNEQPAPPSDSLYSSSQEVPYYFVVIADTKKTDIGRLKFDLINFNLDYYLQKNYSTSSQEFNKFFTAIAVKRFKNHQKAKEYYELISKKEQRVFKQHDQENYRYFFISVKNYVTLLDKKSIIEYINFFNKRVI